MYHELQKLGTGGHCSSAMAKGSTASPCGGQQQGECFE